MDLVTKDFTIAIVGIIVAGSTKHNHSTLLFLQIDRSASKSFLGLIIGAFSLGQLIFAPFFGIWSNYRPITEPWIVCLVFFICGNLLYVFAEAFDDNQQWILLVARFIAGIGAGKKIPKGCLHPLFYLYIFLADITIIRSYCTTASLEEERITVMSFLAAMQALGFILGPGMNNELDTSI